MIKTFSRHTPWAPFSAALMLVTLAAFAHAQSEPKPEDNATLAVAVKTSGGLARPVWFQFRARSDGRVIKVHEEISRERSSFIMGSREQLAIFHIPAGEYILERWMADFEDAEGSHTALSQPIGVPFKATENASLILGRIDLQVGDAEKGKLPYVFKQTALTGDEFEWVARQLGGNLVPDARAAQPPWTRQGQAALTGTALP